ncbi:hypothetical protein Q0N41_11480 [Bacillus altitudinis]
MNNRNKIEAMRGKGIKDTNRYYEWRCMEKESSGERGIRSLLLNQ